MPPPRTFYILTLTTGVFILITLGITFYIIFIRTENNTAFIIIDSDGGVDDIFAIRMLMGAENVIIKAVTTVNGITGIINATRNVKTLMTISRTKQNFAIFPGSEKIQNNAQEGYYGWDGFGDFLPRTPLLPKINLTPAEIIVQLIADNPGKITLLCLGPLTNIAEALEIQPNLLDILKQILIVGGSYKGGGNVGPGLEFNMAADPSSAFSVFNRTSIKNPIKLIPLETIESDASFTKVWRQEWLGKIPSRMTQFFNKAENKSLNKGDNWVCYDQTGASVIIDRNVVLNKIYGDIVVEKNGATQFISKEIDYSVEIVTHIDKQILKLFLIQALTCG